MKLIIIYNKPGQISAELSAYTVKNCIDTLLTSATIYPSDLNNGVKELFDVLDTDISDFIQSHPSKKEIQFFHTEKKNLFPKILEFSKTIYQDIDNGITGFFVHIDEDIDKEDYDETMKKIEQELLLI